MFESVQQIENQGEKYRPFNHSTNELIHIQNILKSQIPLVSIKEINKLRQLIARAAVGEYFLIQAGDCAESFYECDPDSTYANLEFIQQLAEFFQRKTGKSVLQMGRTAGQYAKHRGSLYEISQNERIYSYFGDKLNPLDSWRMLLDYNCSACTYREINQWNRELKPEQKIYTSHEALLLDYEQALTRLDKRSGFYYNRSTHVPWLGNRTIGSREHIDYLKKIANPMALKIGPDIPIPSLIKTINQLDPDYVPGRITLIPSLGVQKVNSILPQLIAAVKKTQRTVLWSCDPMHGNTETLSSGRRVRKLSSIVEEIKSSFLIHRTMGSQLNAIHLEATHQNVTECVDYQSCFSSSGIDFKKDFKSLVDPRLNYVQTMHVIQCLAKYYAKR
jgi:3-deoxy-7-phosphoheptulonate synthase